MILDATAGNRTMWKRKQSDNIIYIDIQRQLEVRPTIFCSNEQLPFPDATFDTIFFDPPHSWHKGHHYHTYPRRTKEYFERWKDRAVPRYYGWERYKTRSQLINHIFHAQQELSRVLKDDGLLWFKWCELSIPLLRILTALTEFRELLRIYVCSPSQTAGEAQTYWVCMEKRFRRGKQSILQPGPLEEPFARKQLKAADTYTQVLLDEHVSAK